ncbi:hypothetical protein HZ326_5653 [Fusarium oxysporum f. sp. albedinis]|nr:hypothetical protein HZ326_5653 [Fusarium oxysporum f. sp. albedinis]
MQILQRLRHRHKNLEKENSVDCLRLQFDYITPRLTLASLSRMDCTDSWATCTAEDGVGLVYGSKATKDVIWHN